MVSGSARHISEIRHEALSGTLNIDMPRGVAFIFPSYCRMNDVAPVLYLTLKVNEWMIFCSKHARKNES